MTQQIRRGDRVLVTGASSGIGEAFAIELAARGANLIITARSRDKLHQLADRLAIEHGVDVRVVVGDLAEPGGPRKLCDDVFALGVEVHHLINNAGVGLSGPFVAIDGELQARMLRLNTEAAVILSRHFIPEFCGRCRGGVLNIASNLAFQPAPYMAVYGASKTFLLHWSLALSAELRDSKVQATVLCLGPVPSGFQEHAGFELGPIERSVALSSAQAAVQGLSAYEAGKDVHVPGAVLRAHSVLAQVAPKRLTSSITASVMRHLKRD